MNILIDNLFLQTGLQKDTFVESIEQTGYPVYVSEYVRNLKEFETWIPCRDTLLVYGSIQFVEDALKHFDNAVAFYNPRQFKCSYFMSHLPINMFVNHDARFFPVGVLQQSHAVRLHHQRWSTADKTSYFIRSDSGRKLFAGKEIEYSNLHSFNIESMSEDSIVLMADAKRIGYEARYFIYRDRVVSRSLTHFHGDPVTETEDYPESWLFSLDKFADGVVSMVDDLGCMDTIYVCDIATYQARSDDSKVKIGIMEFNAASTSDMHLCNVTDIFAAMIDCINKENGCE